MKKPDFLDIAKRFLDGPGCDDAEVLSFLLARAYKEGHAAAAKSVVQWATKNAQRESPLLYPDPAHYVFWEPLLDFITDDAKEAGVTKDTVGEWVDEMQGER